MPKARTKPTESREDLLRLRASSRGYTLIKDGDVWFAEIGGTRWGPMATFDEVEEFLPKGDDA